MKIRQGFVSNSSSSSFLLKVKPEAPIESVKLMPELIEICRKNGFDLDGDEWYLTEFVSDSIDEYEKVMHGIDFQSGSHIGPYDEDDYFEIGNGVWFPREWTENRCPCCQQILPKIEIDEDDF